MPNLATGMSESYEEIIDGESHVRQPPGLRHEQVCGRLATRLEAAVKSLSHIQLLTTRSIVQVSPGTLLRPDLAIVTSANERLFLAIEIVDANDHHLDTVTKKDIYESKNIPRLWMVDPRYDNVEVYHGSPYGLRLQGILAGGDRLVESLFPDFGFVIRELFSEQ